MGDGVLAGVISVFAYSEVCSSNTTYLLICLQNCRIKPPPQKIAKLYFWCLLPSVSSVVLSAVPYLLYVGMLVAVGLSRIFILAHFPHQVIAGSLAGLNFVTLCKHIHICRELVIKTILIPGFILGIILSRRVPQGRSLLFIGIVLLLGTVTLHSGLQWLGIKLSW